jgi:hypothetical protein
MTATMTGWVPPRRVNTTRGLHVTFLTNLRRGYKDLVPLDQSLSRLSDALHPILIDEARIVRERGSYWTIV